jgi:6-phosphogluconolactonase (cycloisomerase 2 family)
MSLKQQSRRVRLLVGGYGTSVITRWSLDIDNKTFTYEGSFEAGNNPSWIAMASCPSAEPDGPIGEGDRLLFVANEVKTYDSARQYGAVSSFRLQADGQVSFVSRVASGGGWPCHIHVPAEVKTIVVSNYADGQACAIPYLPNGALLAEHSVILRFVHPTKGSEELTRGGSHPHHVEQHNGYIYCVDLGMDFIYKFTSKKMYVHALGPPPSSPETREAKADHTAGLQLRTGQGPRHIKFHPFLNVAFVLNECSNTVSVLCVNRDNGDLSFPKAVSFKYCDDLAFSALVMRCIVMNIAILMGLPLLTNKNAATTLNATALAVVNTVLLLLHWLGINLDIGYWRDGEFEHYLENNISSLGQLASAQECDDMNAAELVVTKNGKFLYVSNRDVRVTVADVSDVDRSSISVFRIHSSVLAPPSPRDASVWTKEKGRHEDFISISGILNSRKCPRNYSTLLEGNVYLECIQTVRSYGSHPRYFILVGEDTCLIIANQHSGTVVVLDVDSSTGLINQESCKVCEGDPSRNKVFVQPAMLIPV